MIGAAGLIDFYKADHKSQYPDNTELVFSNFTPRDSRIPDIRQVILFGLQYYCEEYLHRKWAIHFFGRPIGEVVDGYRDRMKRSGFNLNLDHIEALHNYGRLPINVMAIPEGGRVPLRVPMLVMWNSHKDFGWITNYLESNMSNILWKGCTAATIADRYRRKLDEVARETGGDADFVDWQAHDFSYRGLSGTEDAFLVGSGHLLSFTGTDNVPCLDFLDEYYGGREVDGIVGGSVPATEHSVMCMGGQANERDTILRLLQLYPTGIVSIVSDTWDYWKVLTHTLRSLYTEIMKRDGKLVIRPDSGDPFKVICGDKSAPVGSPENMGTYEILWEIFGGTTNDKGFQELDSHIGVIYGDSITYDRCVNICDQLKRNGFVPNLVFGIGSYTYQYVTRDTFGFAVKATYGEVDGKPRNIFKDPKTDSGIKRSAKGLLAVHMEKDIYSGKDEYDVNQQCGWNEVLNCDFQPYMTDGYVDRKNFANLSVIRDQVRRGRASL